MRVEYRWPFRTNLPVNFCRRELYSLVPPKFRILVNLLYRFFLSAGVWLRLGSPGWFYGIRLLRSYEIRSRQVSTYFFSFHFIFVCIYVWFLSWGKMKPFWHLSFEPKFYLKALKKFFFFIYYCWPKHVSVCSAFFILFFADTHKKLAHFNGYTIDL